MRGISEADAKAGVSVDEVPLVAALQPPDRNRLLECASVDDYPPGSEILHEGGRAEHLHVLLAGSVELFASVEGRHCGILLMVPPDMFMPASVLFEEPYLNSARAIAATRILRVPATVARELYATSREFRDEAARAIAGHFRLIVRHIIDLQTRSAPQRLAAFLLRVAEQQSGADTALPWPRRVLAERLGMSPETLSRSIQVVAEEGLYLRGRRIVIRDRSRIEDFCARRPGLDGLDRNLGVRAL